VSLHEDRVREIVREEIASLAGFALGRTASEPSPTRSLERNVAAEVVREEAAEFWGEVLRDFGATASEPGP
jgi:hypothetical protein